MKLFYTNNTDPHYCIGRASGVNAVKYIFFDALTTITPDEIGVDHCNGSGPVRQQLSESAIQTAYPSRLSRQPIRVSALRDHFTLALFAM